MPDPKFVQNYDFGANWDEVLDHLTFPETNDLIKVCFDDLCNGGYSEDVSPADLFSSSDQYVQLIADLVKLFRDGDYPGIISEADKKFIPCDECKNINYYDDYCDKCQDNLNDIDELIRNLLGFDFKFNKDKLAFYVPFGSCHTWNKCFGLPLAKKSTP